MTIRLTHEQQAIVEHEEGPALVFAVAGAGKTTAMVHRMARLVQTRRCAPADILATTFNKEAQLELAERVQRLPGCAQIRPMTLHALGFQILRDAQTNLPAPGNVNHAADQLLNQTIKRARDTRVPYRNEVDNLDRPDFFEYVSRCKGQLAYADLRGADLPQEARRIATQAQPPEHNPWYLDLYRLYEETRRSQGIVTFDDMLIDAWAALHQSPRLLASYQARFGYVLVDEYQDLNLAQSEILDLLTVPHRNYMAIGDDDQTIYTWRGASADHMLAFEKRYGAKRFYMTENFRCRAGQIALANAVINARPRPIPKKLQLTQGFGGITGVHVLPSEQHVANHIVAQIQAAQRKGLPLDQMAVLVRIFAQTGPIEAALIQADIPYTIVGNSPFFRREEVTTLLDYWQLAVLNARIAQGHALDGESAQELCRAWRQIYWRPTRYLPRAEAAHIEQHLSSGRVTLAAATESVTERLNARQQIALREMCRIIDWLAQKGNAGGRAAPLLDELERRLDYKEYLRGRSEYSGAEQADNVDAFISYARSHTTLNQLVQHLHTLREEAEAAQTTDHKSVHIGSIHGAKGKEWTIVFVPGCHDGILPSARALREADHDALAEERRLLYVAITRARHSLHLYTVRDQRISPFLQDADYGLALQKCTRVATILQQPPNQWQLPQDAGELVTYSDELGFNAWFAEWWVAPEDLRQAVGTRAASFIVAALHAQPNYQFRPTRRVRELWMSLAGEPFAAIPMQLAVSPPPPPPPPPPRTASTTGAQPRGVNRPGVSPNKIQPRTKQRAVSTPARKKTGTVVHLMHGQGRIVREIISSGETWLQIRFGQDTLEFRANDPNLRRPS